jgi:hypothetical protein
MNKSAKILIIGPEKIGKTRENRANDFLLAKGSSDRIKVFPGKIRPSKGLKLLE